MTRLARGWCHVHAAATINATLPNRMQALGRLIDALEKSNGFESFGDEFCSDAAEVCAAELVGDGPVVTAVVLGLTVVGCDVGISVDEVVDGAEVVSAPEALDEVVVCCLDDVEAVVFAG